MRFVCLGYLEETRWAAMPEERRAALLEDCFAYDDELRRGGYFVGGETLQSVRNAVTLRHQNGQSTVTGGPGAETREQLGRILILEARDLNHAIHLMSGHPGVRAGSLEIRPANDESLGRRGQAAGSGEPAGCFLINAQDLDEAIAIAGRIPGARVGTVEIRPVMELAGLPSGMPSTEKKPG